MENTARCLNCGATLVGRFCSACGQRVVPAHPTVRELAGDAWNELSGYDGRIAATLRGLLRPGLLTRHYIDGQRASYLSPVRLYLIVSVVYFLIAAAAPSMDANGQRTVGPGVRVSINGANPSAMVTPEERAQLLKAVDDAPWMLRPMLRAIANSPEEFRARLFTVMPRVFFAMLPVFAAIVFLFYRADTFVTALVFAVHLHAVAFIAAAVTEAAKFSGSPAIAAPIAGIATVVFAIYAIKAVRAVFGGRLAATLAKAAAISVLYLVASVPAFFVIMMWAALA
jgi:hypothetical protein